MGVFFLNHTVFNRVFEGQAALQSNSKPLRTSLALWKMVENLCSRPQYWNTLLLMIYVAGKELIAGHKPLSVEEVGKYYQKAHVRMEGHVQF